MAGDDAELRALQRRAYGAGGDALTADETHRLTELVAARREPPPAATVADIPTPTETAAPTAATAPPAAPTPAATAAPGTPATRGVEPGPSRRRWIRIAAAAAVVLVAFACGWFLRGGPAIPDPLKRLDAQYGLALKVADANGMDPSTLLVLGPIGGSDQWVAGSTDGVRVCSFLIPQEASSDSPSVWPLPPQDDVATTCGSSDNPMEISAVTHMSAPGGESATVTSYLFWPRGEFPIVIQDVSPGSGTSVTVLANDVGAELMDTVLIDPSAIAARVPQLPGATVQLAGVINGASVWAVKANDGSGAYCGVFARVDRATGDVSAVDVNCGAGPELELTTPTVSYTDPQTAVMVLDGASLTGFRLYLVWQSGEATVAIRPA